MYRIAVVALSLALAAVSFSARLAAASDGDGASGVNWIKYADPAEHAFALNVPQGWEVKGGAYRFGYFDVRWMIDARSPDGKIIIRIDDVNVPPYVLPGPNTGGEGQPYDKPREFQMVVERYQNADAYAQIYLTSRFKHVCHKSHAARGRLEADAAAGVPGQQRHQSDRRQRCRNLRQQRRSARRHRVRENQSLPGQQLCVLDRRPAHQHPEHAEGHARCPGYRPAHARFLPQKSAVGRIPAADDAGWRTDDSAEFPDLHGADACIRSGSQQRDEPAGRGL